jgi:hypothetical protein
MQARVKRGFTIGTGRSKAGPDEVKGFVSGAEPFGYHPKMGFYPDLFNHLFGTALGFWLYYRDWHSQSMNEANTGPYAARESL